MAWCIHLLLVLVTSFVPQIGYATTCQAQPEAAVVGEEVVITCDFGTDIAATTKTFSVKVRRADHSEPDYTRDTVIDCNWNHNIPSCHRIMDGFEFDRLVGSNMTVKIPSVTQTYAGRYVCSALPSQPSYPKPCTLSVKDAIDTTGVTTVEDDELSSASSLPLQNETQTLNISSHGGDHEAKTAKLPPGIVIPVITLLSLAVIVIVVTLVFRKRCAKAVKRPKTRTEGDGQPDPEDCILKQKTPLPNDDSQQKSEARNTETEFLLRTSNRPNNLQGTDVTDYAEETESLLSKGERPSDPQNIDRTVKKLSLCNFLDERQPKPKTTITAEIQKGKTPALSSSIGPSAATEKTTSDILNTPDGSDSGKDVEETYTPTEGKSNSLRKCKSEDCLSPSKNRHMSNNTSESLGNHNTASVSHLPQDKHGDETFFQQVTKSLSCIPVALRTSWLVVFNPTAVVKNWSTSGTAEGGVTEDEMSDNYF